MVKTTKALWEFKSLQKNSGGFALSHPCTSLRTMYRSRRLFFEKASAHSRGRTSLRKKLRWLRLYPCKCRHDASTFCRFAPCGTGESFYSIFTRRSINAYVAPFLVKNKRFFLRHTLRSKISIICEACSKPLPKTTGGILSIRIIFTKSLKNCWKFLLFAVK